MYWLKRITLFLILSLTIPFVAYPQEKKTSVQPQAPKEATATPPRPPLAFGLVEDTPVKLKLTRTMSSSDAKVDERVDFEVLEDVKIGDVVVIQHGGMAIATVYRSPTKAQNG